MFENLDIEKLKRAKEKLEDLKALKFSLSASKHKNDKYGFPDLLRHYLLKHSSTPREWQRS